MATDEILTQNPSGCEDPHGINLDIKTRSSTSSSSPRAAASRIAAHDSGLETISGGENANGGNVKTTFRPRIATSHVVPSYALYPT